MSLFDFFMKPVPLPYDFEEWKRQPFSRRAKMMCQAWAMQGFGAPIGALIFYAIKIALYLWVWTLFCSTSTSLGGLDEIGTWWFKLDALAKAVFWTVLIEVIGLGGASGPLTGRYMPPFGGITYYLRPGTIKVPLFSSIPLLNSDKRNLIDILLYAGLLFSLARACVAPEITLDVVLPMVILLPILGVLDRQIYLAARADVWYPAIFALVFPFESVAILKVCWFGVWFWAAFSKLTPTFSSVVAVMICNSPVLKIKALKKMLFKNYPEDLRLSRGATYMAHFGTVVEFSLPILLISASIFSWPPELTFYALVGMTIFHTFIFVNLPMGVPMEWNIIMVYGGWVLFAMNPDVSPMTIYHAGPMAFLVACYFVLPLIGNFFPKYVSFLLSMRYYAGTWAYSVWLFKKGVKEEKLEPNIVKTSPDIRVQLERLYDPDTIESIIAKIIPFRMMHLPGRALHDLLPKAVDDIEDYNWLDGEFIAGEVVGWNFGDGHLHHEPVLRSIQKRCGFEPGELRVIMVESPQFHNGRLHWRIHDASDGLMEEGETFIRDLVEKMPWPEHDL